MSGVLSCIDLYHHGAITVPSMQLQLKGTELEGVSLEVNELKGTTRRKGGSLEVMTLRELLESKEQGGIRNAFDAMQGNLGDRLLIVIIISGIVT